MHARPINDEEVRHTLRQRTARRGQTIALANKIGKDPTHLSRMRTGVRPITIELADELGFTLAWVRTEELALADKIEAEITQTYKGSE